MDVHLWLSESPPVFVILCNHQFFSVRLIIIYCEKSNEFNRIITGGTFWLPQIQKKIIACLTFSFFIFMTICTHSIRLTRYLKFASFSQYIHINRYINESWRRAGQVSFGAQIPNKANWKWYWNWITSMASQYKSIDGRDDDISVSLPWPIIVELDLIYSMHWLAHWYGFQLNQNESSQVKPG